jgi:hypothetical protein
LERGIVPESVGIVDILVPRGDLIQPLADECVKPVRDVARVVTVGDPSDHVGTEPEMVIEFSDEQEGRHRW